MRDISKFISPVFSKHHFEFYEFPTANSCGSDDTEMNDGFHGGERCYQKLLLAMLRKNSILNQYCDSSKLKLDLNKSMNKYIVYEY